MTIFTEPTNRRTSLRLLIALFAASLAVRLVFTLPVIAVDMPLRGDVPGYVARAVGFRDLIERLGQGESIKIDDLDAFYQEGKWPPLHPFVLSLGFLVFDVNIGVARLTVTLISALTTPLVYLVAKRLANHRAAFFSALIHIFFPSFVAFAHLLWSETLFIFLILLAIYLSTFLRDAVTFRQSAPYALGSGIILGLSGLTRPTILPLLLLLPLWAFFNISNIRLRLVIPILIFLTSIAILIPWELLLYEKEGHFVLLVTTGDLNLFAANHPTDVTFEDVRLLAEENNLDPDAVMRDIAIETILDDPVTVLGSNFGRTLWLWSVDEHVFKHLRRAVYPPIPHPLFVIWFLVSFVSYLIVAFSAGLGFILQWRPLKNYSNLLLALIFARMLFPMFLTGGNARLTVVNFALMLPAAGYALTNFKTVFQGRYKLVTVVLVSLLPIVILLNVRNGYSDTTGYYASLVNKYHIFSGRRTEVIDRFLFQSLDPGMSDHLTLKVLFPEYNINDPGRSEVIWKITPKNQSAEFIVFSYDSSRPVELELTSANSGEMITLQPINPKAWQNWQPTGLEGLSYQWLAVTQTIQIPPPP